jgi:endonuclease III-like uncharacterized protein
MPYAEEHKHKCLDQRKSIENYFVKYPKIEDHNELLYGLLSLSGIGLTVASGLIWSAHRNLRVPFDKYTATYALKLKLMRSERISSNYIRFCESIKEYCDRNKYTIEDFVRISMKEMEYSYYLIDPK